MAPRKQESTVLNVTLTLIEWLVSDRCYELDDAGLIAMLGGRLNAVGLPIDRLTLHLRTLHPEIFGRTIAWAPGEPVEIRDRGYGVMTAKAFAGSPLLQVMESRRRAVVRADTRKPAPWLEIDVFRARGLVEFVMVPLASANGPVSAVCFVTKNQRGFSANHLAVIDRITPALRSVCELRALRQTELALLDTYIGAGTAKRVLAGSVRRGQAESIEAALMLCDLHGFTALSNRLPEDQVLHVLNDYFDRVVPTISAAGGEILKFMGDAVLAFFPHEDARSACSAALEAANGILDRLDEPVAGGRQLEASIGLHYGKVSYGNIGSGTRLDFTVIGPDVNLLSRIQGAGAARGDPLLMSARFVAEVGNADRALPLGEHVLKGFARPVPLYGRGEAAPVAAE